jgi:hypothetical protein
LKTSSFIAASKVQELFRIVQHVFAGIALLLVGGHDRGIALGIAIPAAINMVSANDPKSKSLTI